MSKKPLIPNRVSSEGEFALFRSRKTRKIRSWKISRAYHRFPGYDEKSGEFQLTWQALRRYRAFSTRSLSDICAARCQSLSARREETGGKGALHPKKRTPVVLPVVKPPRGVNTTAFTTYSRDWLPPRAKHLLLLSLTLLRDDSCSRAAL